MVPISGILILIALPHLIYRSFVGLIRKRSAQIAFAITSIPIAIILAVLEMNIFTGLSPLFGIRDYQLM